MSNKKRPNFDSLNGRRAGDGVSVPPHLRTTARPGMPKPHVQVSPHAQALKRKQNLQAHQANAGDTKDVHISLKLSVPTSVVKKLGGIKKVFRSFKKLRVPKPSSLTQARYFKPAVGVFAVLLVAFGAWEVFINKPPARPDDQGQVQGAQNSPPDFEPVVPADKKDIERKFDSQRRVFSYNDTLAGIPVTVSQQKMPDSFKLDPQGSVETLAKKFNATTPIDAGDTKAFAGKSSQGPQSVIFHKNGNLIFIYAGQEISKENIITYIKILGG